MKPRGTLACAAIDIESDRDKRDYRGLAFILARVAAAESDFREERCWALSRLRTGASAFPRLDSSESLRLSRRMIGTVIISRL